MVLNKKSLFNGLFFLAASGLASGSNLPDTKEGNWYVNGFIQHNKLSESYNNIGSGLNLGYNFNNKWALYGGYQKHSSKIDDNGASDGLVFGVDYFYADDLFLFSEVSKFSSFDVGFNFGAGMKYDLGDRWSAVLDLGMDDDLDPIINAGIRYDFDSPVVKAKENDGQRVAPPLMYDRFNLDIKFAHDSSVIVSKYFTQAEKLVEILNNNKNLAVTIEGHTSLIGSVEYNQKLSFRRAIAVKELLTSKYNIDSNRIRAVGFGESMPVVLGESSYAQSVNRRVIAEVTYLTR